VAAIGAAAALLLGASLARASFVAGPIDQIEVMFNPGFGNFVTIPVTSPNPANDIIFSYANDFTDPTSGATTHISVTAKDYITPDQHLGALQFPELNITQSAPANASIAPAVFWVQWQRPLYLDPSNPEYGPGGAPLLSGFNFINLSLSGTLGTNAGDYVSVSTKIGMADAGGGYAWYSGEVHSPGPFSLASGGYPTGPSPIGDWATFPFEVPATFELDLRDPGDSSNVSAVFSAGGTTDTPEPSLAAVCGVVLLTPIRRRRTTI